VDSDAPQQPKRSPIFEEVATALLEKHVLELRPGATVKEFADALEIATSAPIPKMREIALLELFDDALVDEVFLDDDELISLARQLSKQLV
jgi:hypothetical protein